MLNNFRPFTRAVNVLVTAENLERRGIFVSDNGVCFLLSRGIKNYTLPRTYEGIEIPAKGKPRFMEKVPPNPGNVKMPKMIKNLRFMRGPEEIHNELIHKQYGIIALGGGRMRHGHFEMVRNTIGRKMDVSRMFTFWRLDPPWQPITKKGQGQRMGGGKGAIDHYVTPIKSGRVIIELAGNCDYDEVRGVLEQVAKQLPFQAMAVSQDIMEHRKALLEKQINENKNPYTFEYMIKNNLGNCKKWVKRIDYFHFGRYV